MPDQRIPEYTGNISQDKKEKERCHKEEIFFNTTFNGLISGYNISPTNTKKKPGIDSLSSDYPLHINIKKLIYIRGSSIAEIFQKKKPFIPPKIIFVKDSQSKQNAIEEILNTCKNCY